MVDTITPSLKCFFLLYIFIVKQIAVRSRQLSQVVSLTLPDYNFGGEEEEEEEALIMIDRPI